jgi:hypothetical protein
MGDMIPQSLTAYQMTNVINAVPFREKDADIERNLLQATGRLAHKVGGGVPVRSGHLNVGVPPVLESGSDLAFSFFAIFGPT